MSQICNKLLPIDDWEELELKDASIKLATGEQYLALAELSLAAFKLEQSGEVEYATAQLQASIRHLKSAIQHHNVALALVKDARPTDETFAWLAKFDFDRFFEEKTADGSIPSRPDLWGPIVAATKRGDAAYSTALLCSRLGELHDNLQQFIKSNEWIEQPIRCVRYGIGSLAELQILGTMIAGLNDVRPFDQSWLIPLPTEKDSPASIGGGKNL